MKLRQVFFLLLFSILFLLFFFNRGFTYYDEGFILHSAQRLTLGEIIYQDFDFIYTPGTVFLLGIAFKIFGESILIGRILVLLISAMTATLVYFISYIISKHKVIAFLSLLIYLSWGPSHINFPWPTVFTFSSGLLATHLLAINPFFSGIFAVVSGLFKQNFGLAVLISSLLSFFLYPDYRKRRYIVFFIYGIFITGFFFFAYLLITRSTLGFLNNIVYTWRSVITNRAFSTEFPGGLKSLIYLFPGIISLLALLVTYKNKSKFIIYPLFTLLFYFFGIRPTTDYPHLVMLMAMTGIPISLFMNYGLRITNFIIISLEILLIIGGFYTSIWRNYYKWDSSLVKQTYFISHPRAKIFVDQKFKTVIPEITDFVEQKSRKGDYIFVFYNASIFYFLTDRLNPTRYINFSPDRSLGEVRELEVINNLKNKKVKIIITHEPPENWGNPIITDFILKNYQKKKQVFEFGLWEKS